MCFLFSQMLPQHFVSIVLCLIASYANAVEVSNAEGLLAVFKNPTGKKVDEEIFIKADIDFSQPTPLVLPLGTQSSGNCVAYGGVLHGNGHSF